MKYWYISDIGSAHQADVGADELADGCRKGIGNYFETKKEAEKAVERLKSEIAYLKGKINAYEKFLKLKGFIAERPPTKTADEAWANAVKQMKENNKFNGSWDE